MGFRSIIVCALSLAAVVMLSACSTGDSARVSALAPAVKSAWDAAGSADAELGVKAHESPAAAAALGIPVWSPPVAGQRRELHKQIGEGINKLQPKSTTAPPGASP